MKKIFITLIICILITVAVTYITKSDFLYNSLVKDIDIEEVQINDMEITNSTYYYNTLTSEEQKIYRIIAKGIMDIDTSITIDVTEEVDFTAVKENIEIALNSFLADHPEVFYVDDKYEISMVNMLAVKVVNLNLDYISDNKKEIANMKEELNNEISKINSKLAGAQSDYEKEVLLHDLLATNIDYFAYSDYNEIPSVKHTVYGALVEKSAVCDGITKALQILLNKNNIDSIFVTGVSEGVPHAWCKVKIEGEYYNVDITSDKALNSENRDLIVHSYLNVSDQEISRTHSFDNYDKLPVATADRYNYYVYNDYTLSYFDNFQYKMSQIVNKQATKRLLEFRVVGISDVPAKVVEALYNINFNNYKTNNITKIQYNKINDNYIIVK